MKRITAMLMAGLLAAGALSGCGSGADGKTDSSSGHGRYVEEDMEFPLSDTENVVNFTKSGEGNPLIFASDGSQVIRYEYKEEAWERTELAWTRSLLTGGMISVDDAEETADGTQYIMTTDNETMQRTFTRQTADQAEAGEGEKVGISYLETEGEFGYPMVTDIAVDPSGNYWLVDVVQNMVLAVDGKTDETLLEIPVTGTLAVSQKMLFQGTDGEIAFASGDGSYVVYDTDTLEETGSLSTDCSTENGYALSSDGTYWYQISEDGISRMKEGNEIEEIIMDGNGGGMGSPLNMVSGMVPAGEGEFYVLYAQYESGTYSLEHYVYDEDVPSVPEHTLTVFGLTKNDTVQQAITQFQKVNPDVQVEFTSLGKAAGEVTTEDIRTLNTELLSGNGADVLLLDGLPADSYIEKGILEDLSSLLEEITESGEYLETMLENTIRSEDGVFGLPVKFSVPLMFGNSEAAQALESLDSLSAYLDENPDAAIFGSAKTGYIRDVLLMLYQDEVLGTDGKVDQNRLAKLLLTAERIAENGGADEADSVSYAASESLEVSSPFSENEDGMDVLSDPDSVGTTDVGSLSTMMIPYAVMRRAGLTPETIQNMYHPQGTVGINSASEEKDLAEEFVKFLFTDEIQSAALNDGFPVLLSALDEKADEAAAASGNFSAAVAVDGEDGMEMELTASYPEEEEVRQFTELCRTLDAPMEQNRIVWNIYQEEADRCLEGSVEADEAAKNIAQKVDTWLAEQE